MKALLRPLTTLTLLTGFAVASPADAAPVKLASLPVTIEPNPKMEFFNDDGIRMLFPSPVGRPNAVFTTTDRKVSVAFEWRNGKLQTNEVQGLITEYPALLKANVPNIKSLKSNLVQISGQPWAQFVMTTPGQGDDKRVEFMITSAKGRVLVVTIVGNLKDYSRNETAIKALTNSVKIN